MKRNTDVLSKKQRSYCMSRIKSKNTSPENRLRDVLRGLYFRFQPRIYGKPDFASKKNKIVIFVDGCFWHKCPLHFKKPKTNISFWKNKINQNLVRDAKINSILLKNGWKIVRIWEHELKSNKCCELIKTKLDCPGSSYDDKDT
jgi:DNA mismatch endonuclease, patch repair protein